MYFARRRKYPKISKMVCVNPKSTTSVIDSTLLPDLQRALKDQGVAFVERITQKIVLEVEARIHAAQGAHTHQEREVSPTAGLNKTGHLSSSIKDILIAEESCPVCYEPLGQDAVIMRCEHSFCEECLDR